MFSVLKGPYNEQLHRRRVSRSLPRGPTATVALAPGPGSVEISQGQPEDCVALVLVIQKNVVCRLICLFPGLADNFQSFRAAGLC